MSEPYVLLAMHYKLIISYNHHRAVSVMSTYHSFHVRHILARDGAKRRHEIFPVGEWVELGEGPLGIGHAKVDA